MEKLTWNLAIYNQATKGLVCDNPPFQMPTSTEMCLFMNQLWHKSCVVTSSPNFVLKLELGTEFMALFDEIRKLWTA